jgi:hypothetical protein
MKPALFVFADNGGSSCVFVRNCNSEAAYDMIARTITHDLAPSLELFDATEYTALFVLANKKEPFDMIVTGEFDETSDAYEDVEGLYEITKSQDGNAIIVVPVTDEDGISSIWEMRRRTVH